MGLIPPSLWTMLKKTAIFANDGFPKPHNLSHSWTWCIIVYGAAGVKDDDSNGDNWKWWLTTIMMISGQYKPKTNQAISYFFPIKSNDITHNWSKENNQASSPSQTNGWEQALTERPAATLAVKCIHTSCVRRKLASFHPRGWSRQASRGSRYCPQSILPPDGCWHPAPPSGLSGCPHPDMLFLSTATSLPLLCRTWKGDWGKRGMEAPGSDPLDPTAFIFFDFNRSDLSVFVHQGSVRPLLASLTLLLIVCDDHPWFEGLEHRHCSCDHCHNHQLQ